MLEEGITYFSFTFQENFLNSDLSNNFTYQPVMIGYVKRKVIPTENTLNIVDTKTKEICSKLKELNIRTSYRDVSVLDNIQKIMVTGSGKYNQINNELV
jgi:hypothetical protein